MRKCLFFRMGNVGGENKRLIFGESNLCKNRFDGGVCMGKPNQHPVDTRGLI